MTGGTDNHLLLIDVVRSTDGAVAGKAFAQALDRAGIVCNYNTVPFDPRKPFNPSGIRLGTPSLTTRAMGASEMVQLADFMRRVLDNMENEETIAKVRDEVRSLCRAFPAPGLEYLED